jgi:hypothetical protein
MCELYGEEDSEDDVVSDQECTNDEEEVHVDISISWQLILVCLLLEHNRCRYRFLFWGSASYFSLFL